MKFVSLHHHSTFSYMDGFGTPAQHIERAAELGMSALALTEHGNNSSHVGLEKAALKAGVKPIYGLEAYTALGPGERRKFHLTMLAADQQGYRNLNQIITRSWAEGFHQWPTVFGGMIADNPEGLIVLSGCSDSLLACALLGGKSIPESEASWKRALYQAEAFRELLGDRFYLECQIFPELERAKKINQAYERMNQVLGIPLVATADVHTLKPGQHEIRAVLHAAGRGNNTIAQQMSGWEYEVPDYVPLSDRLVFDRLMATGMSKAAAQSALRATGEIAERCNVTLPKADRLRFPLEPGQTSSDLIWDWLRDGWKYRVSQGADRLRKDPDTYVARMKYEMEQISNKDFIDYFLMISEIVRYAKDNGIAVGPARGSAAASLVCWLLRITEIDPLQYPLMYFDRFIAPDRMDIPDIDLDFDDERRHLVRAYAVQRYGEERVANIGTFTKYKGKNSIDDVARVYQIPKTDAEKLKSMVVERSGGDSRSDASLADTLAMFPAAHEILEKHPDLNKAIEMEGNYRGMSVHAAGLVITNGAISDVCAMYTREVKGTNQLLTAVSVNKYDAEYLNLMKMDFLGLSTMGMIRIALDFAGLTLEQLYRVPMDDPETLEAFRRNDVVGIFQFEGRATRLVGREVEPDTFLELADINGLSRPGPLFSGTTAEYIKVKKGLAEPTRFHPIVDQHTKFTKGQIIYQEQVLAILREFGGLPVQKVHDIRKIISQKLGEAQFNKSADDFVVGARELHGVSEDIAREVWKRLVTSATYSFNIAHCVSYSMLAFWCMWLKVHHPEAFYAAQLRKTAEKKWPRLIKDAQAHGIEVRGVTPRLSQTMWRPMMGKRQVIAGWQQLRGIGAVVARRIEEYAKAHVIESADDLLEVRGIGEKSVEKFRTQIEGDDPFGLLRVSLSLNSVREAIADRDIPVRRPTTNSDGILDIAGGETVVWVGMVKLKEYKDFLEDERARSGKSIEEIRRTMKRPDLPTSCVLHCYDDGDEDVYVRITRYDYQKWAAGLEAIRTDKDVIHVAARKSNGGFGASLYLEKLVVIDPDDDDEENEEQE